MESNEEARLRLFLQEYERVCKRYNLIVYLDMAPYPHEEVCERNIGPEDYLPEHIENLKAHGINE